MGEIADMMLNGDMCQWCGEWIGNGDGPGYPGLCAGCAAQERKARSGKRKKRKSKHTPPSDS